MELHQLRCFQVIIEEGGFKRATTRLHITQPALSYQVKQLETELGTLLFHRRPGGVTPTEAGRVLSKHTQKILESVRRAELAVKELADGVAGEIRIGTVNSVGIHFLPHLLWNMRANYPMTKPRVLYGESQDIVDALLADKIDLAIVADPRADRRLNYEPLIEDRISLVSGQPHPLYGVKKIKPKDLNGVQFVALSPVTPTGELISRYLARLGVTVEPVVTTRNVETVKKMVEVGLGVAFLPDMVTSSDIAMGNEPPGRLTRCRVEPPLKRSVVLVTWKSSDVSRAVKIFIEELHEQARIWIASARNPTT